MAQNPTSKNDSFAYVQGTSNITLTGRDAELAIRLGTTSLPATTDTSLADTNALFAVRNTALDFAWRLSTKSSIALGETGTVGCGFFLMRDNTDAGGEGTSRVKYYDLSAEASRTFPNSGTYVSQASGTGTILAADLVQPGTYKVIAVMYKIDGQAESDTTPPKASLGAVANGTTFYLDSDAYLAASAGLTAAPCLNVFGIGRVARVRVAADVQSISTSVSPAQAYTDQPTVTYDITSATLNNPKSLRCGPTLKTAGATTAPIKTLTNTPTTAGAVTTSAYNVDTLFTQTNATYRERIFVGNTGGQSSTLAGETPDLLSSGTLVLADANDKAWICFTAGSGTALVSSNQLAIEGTTDFTAGYDVQINTKTITSAGGATLYNRGETFSADFFFKDVNGRDITSLLGTSTLRAKDTGGATEGTSVDIAIGGYTLSYTIGTSDTATFDLVGSQKHLNVIFAAYGSNNPTIDYPTGLGLTHLVSREWQFSTVSGSINGNIFTGKAASPASDTTLVRNHEQALFFNCFVFNARGELLGSPASNFGVRRLIDETFDTSNATFTLASGQFTGASATYRPTSTDLVGPKTLVFGSATTGGTNQPRTGTGGSGNFAETSLSNWTTPDSSGNGHTGTVIGPTDMYGPPVILTTGGGMLFEGTNRGVNGSAIDTGYSTTIPATGFCVECRFIPMNSVIFDANLVGKTSAVLSSVILGMATSTSKLRCTFGTSGSSVQINGTTTLVVGTPYAAAIDYDGTTARVWLKRGSIAASLEGSAVMTFQDRVSNSLFIGGDVANNATMFKGLIDEVRVSNISRYPSSFDPGTTPFTADANTLLLYHLDTVNQGGEFALSQSGKMTPHLQLGDVPLDPSLNVASRPVTTMGQISAKVTDASGDGYNGAVGDISLRDDADARPVQLDSAQTTATLNGFAGYIPLKDWDSGLPVGGWDEWASANFIKDGNVFIMPRKEAASYDFTLTSPAGTSKKVTYLFDD